MIASRLGAGLPLLTLAAFTAACGASQAAPATRVPLEKPAQAAPEPVAAPADDPVPAGYVAMKVLDIDKRGKAVVLVDEDGGLHIPIYIDPAQGKVIGYRLRGETFPRPLTHDLLDAVMDRLGAEVLRVQIDKLAADTLGGEAFFARVVVRGAAGIVHIDARSTDAIAIALSHELPVHVSEPVRTEAGIRVDTPVETGVPACDRYFRRYLRCYDEKAKVVDRISMRSTLVQEGQAMQEAAVDAAKMTPACIRQEARIAAEWSKLPCWQEVDATPP